MDLKLISQKLKVGVDKVRTKLNFDINFDVFGKYFADFEFVETYIKTNEGLFRIFDITGQSRERISILLKSASFPMQISVISTNFFDNTKSKKIEHELVDKYKDEKLRLREIEEFMDWFRRNLMISLIPKKLFFLTVGVKTNGNGGGIRKENEEIIVEILNKRTQIVETCLDSSYLKLLKRNQIFALMNNYNEECVHMNNTFVSINHLFERFSKNKEEFYVPKA